MVERTEYNGDGPSCSVDSRFGSLPPRNNEMSSVDDRLKQLPIFGIVVCIYMYIYRDFVCMCEWVCNVNNYLA